jgi:hypothetical protein
LTVETSPSGVLLAVGSARLAIVQSVPLQTPAVVGVEIRLLPILTAAPAGAAARVVAAATRAARKAALRGIAGS